ncbi:MAG: PDZ domain-containing protein, partial [Bacillota bacterium]|nr:PDZ domain-containing protein [Bacillota bacterium]
MQFKLNNEQDNGSFDGRDNKGMSRRNKILLLVFIFILTNVCSVYVGNRMSVTTGAKVAEQSDDGASYQKLFEVQQLLEKYYYKDIDQNKLVEGAIKGLADSLGDPYTVFMNKKEYDDFNTTTVGAYVGVGLQVGVKDDKITVIAPFDNSPAKAAGIATGDVITKVNDKDVAGKDLDTAVSMMKGKEGEDVALTLYREGKGSFQVTVKRAKIDIKTVKSEMLPGNIGYIQLTMWDEKSY